MIVSPLIISACCSGFFGSCLINPNTSRQMSSETYPISPRSSSTTSRATVGERFFRFFRRGWRGGAGSWEVLCIAAEEDAIAAIAAAAAGCSRGAIVCWW